MNYSSIQSWKAEPIPPKGHRINYFPHSPSKLFNTSERVIVRQSSKSPKRCTSHVVKLEEQFCCCREGTGHGRVDASLSKSPVKNLFPARPKKTQSKNTPKSHKKTGEHAQLSSTLILNFTHSTMQMRL